MDAWGSAPSLDFERRASRSPRPASGDRATRSPLPFSASVRSQRNSELDPAVVVPLALSARRPSASPRPQPDTGASLQARAAMAARSLEELGVAEDAVAALRARGLAESESCARDLADAMAHLRNARAAEHAAAGLRRGERAEVAAEGRRLFSRLEAAEREEATAAGARISARERRAGSEAELQGVADAGVAEERELRAHLERAQQQVYRLAHVLATSPASDGRQSEKARAKARAALGEATALQRELAAEADCCKELGDLLAEASSRQTVQRLRQEEQARGRARLVQQALGDLQHLHATIGTRYEELRRFAERDWPEPTGDGAPGFGATASGPSGGEVEALRRRASSERAAADRVLSELGEVARQEHFAEEAELRLLASARDQDAALRSLRSELAASERRGAELAAFASRAGRTAFA